MHIHTETDRDIQHQTETIIDRYTYRETDRETHRKAYIERQR